MRMLFVCMLVSMSSLVSAEPTMHRFYLDYAVVQENFKGDKGRFEELMAFAKAYPKQADFIAEFWWNKVKKECALTFSEIAKRYASQVTPAMAAAELEKLKARAKEESDQCAYGVYYDHWDEINSMIEQRFKSLREKERQ